MKKSPTEESLMSLVQNECYNDKLGAMKKSPTEESLVSLVQNVNVEDVSKTRKRTDLESLESNYTANTIIGRKIDDFSVPIFSKAKDEGQVQDYSNLEEEFKRNESSLNLASKSQAVRRHGKSVGRREYLQLCMYSLHK